MKPEIKYIELRRRIGLQELKKMVKIAIGQAKGRS